MKKNIILIAGILLGLALIFFFAVWFSRRKEDPEVLLNWLKKGKGDREEILMRLNMARGDVSTPMIKAFSDRRSNVKFRAEVLDLLFKKNLRTPEAVVESTLVMALRDTSVFIRRRAVDDFALYTDSRLQPVLIPYLQDPDPQVRSKVYNVFIMSEDLWNKISDAQRTAIVEGALKQRPLETDTILAFLNRSVIGREIALLCQKGINAFLKTDLGLGDSLFNRALSLDSGNYRSSMMLANYKLENGGREEALKLSRAAGTLAEIPRLPQAPVIDGDPSDAVWNKAYATEKFVRGNAFAFRIGTGKGKLMLGYAAGTLYAAVICYEKDVSKLKITPCERDGHSIWGDDGVEIVLSPKIDKRRYYKFIVNAGGSLYDRFSSNSAANFKCQSATKVFKDRGYWCLEFAVNGKDLDNNVLKPNDLWNLCIIWNRFGATDERDYFWYDYDDDIMALALFKP